LSEDSQARKVLTTLVTQCFQTLDTFGKPPEALASMVQMFQAVLGRFTTQEVQKAFSIYMETQTVIPKPADIVRLIEPPENPRNWCKVTFLDIKRRQREEQFISDDEIQYCKDFISATVTASSDTRELLEGAIKQAQIDHKRYWSG